MLRNPSFTTPFPLWLAAAVIGIAVTLLYGPFLHNPLVFDDHNFFTGASHPRYAQLSAILDLTPRWLPYASLEWTGLLFGDDIFWYRLGNLLLHIAVAVVLFVFLRALFSAMSGEETTEQGCPEVAPRLSSSWLAFFGALLFALHPVAVYGAAYLIQRSILMASLFSLLCWFLFMQGAVRGRPGMLAGSVLAYLLAVLSKEHAIMAPAVSFSLWLLLGRPGRRGPLIAVFVAYAAIAAYLILCVKLSVIAHTYEPNAPGMLSVLSAQDQGFDPAMAWPLSMLTQTWLYFKYLWVWIFPGPAWMSVDMYEPFALRLSSWPQVLGPALFLANGLLALRLLLKRGARGVLGLALLAPWLLFFTELSTVRIQESFVLYRSYLWMPLLFASLMWLCRNAPPRRAAAALTILVLILVPVTWQRLVTFSSPFELWHDAARLIHDKEGRPGIERIYHNRGLQLALHGQAELALADFDKALALNPTHVLVYNDRASVHLARGRHLHALADYDRALALDPAFGRSYYGRALTHAAMGDSQAALDDFQRACQQGFRAGCGAMESLPSHLK